MNTIGSREEFDAEEVRRRDVRFRVRPIYGVRNGSSIQVGLEMELSAGAGTGDQALKPRGTATELLYRKLRRLTEHSTPPLPDGCRVEFLPYRGAVHFGATSTLRPRVGARLQILHRRKYFREVDEDQLTLAEGLKKAFRMMGIREE